MRVLLALIAAAASLSYGTAAAALVLALVNFGALPVAGASTEAILLGGAVALGVAWRWRWVRSRERVALWLEERIPQLQYALVTRLDPRFAAIGTALESQMEGVRLEPPVWRAVRRAFLPATLVLAVATTVLAASSRADVLVALRERGVGVISAAPRGALEGITVQVVAPSYAGGRTQELRDPETISGLPGSRVTITGRLAAAGITARLGVRPMPVDGEPWRTMFAMPSEPMALRIEHSPGTEVRLIVVQPTTDAPPRAVLTIPARDTLLRAPPATVAVRADFSDDIGLADAVIEYLISSGQEETYRARTDIAVKRDFGSARGGQLSATLSAATLRLGPGDVLSIRAMARDRNNVGGPGLGTSETRTIRIARSDEYDSLAVEAMAPVFGDSALLSQRVILQLTEALVRQLASLAREAVVERSSALALDQERLRNRVHSIVFPGHEHADESPLAGEPPDHADPADPVNVDLREAYEAMWEAGRELRIASPTTAVPAMRVAVDALDRARMAKRRYLRGGTARVVVDLERVRLAGTEKGSSAGRAPRAAADTVLRALSGRLEEIAAAGGLSPSARANALSELRVELLGVSPQAAAALGRAAAALRSGRSPAREMAAARTALAGVPLIRDGAIPWSGW